MRDFKKFFSNKKVNLFFIFALLIIVTMAIGYSLNATRLNMEGTSSIDTRWDIMVTEVNVVDRFNARNIKKEITGPLEVNLSADIYGGTGSYIDYEITVVNNGNVDAVLNEVKGVDEANASDPTEIIMTVEDDIEGMVIYPYDSITFGVEIKFSDEATKTPDIEKNFNIEVVVSQESSSGTIIYPEDSCFTVENGVLTSYNCFSQYQNIIIPQEINGETITEIGEEVFGVDQIGDAVRRISLPNTVTKIGNRAFANSAIREIVLNEGLVTIGDEAFKENINIHSIKLPSTLKSIGNSAFSYNSLETVIIPDSVTSIGNYAFAYNALTSVTIGSSVETIGDAAFLIAGPLNMNPGSNFNLKKIINKTNKAFNWVKVAFDDFEDESSNFVTGTYYYDFYWMDQEDGTSHSETRSLEVTDH